MRVPAAAVIDASRRTGLHPSDTNSPRHRASSSPSGTCRFAALVTHAAVLRAW